jgi:hypothetical protein
MVVHTKKNYAIIASVITGILLKLCYTDNSAHKDIGLVRPVT